MIPQAKKISVEKLFSEGYAISRLGAHLLREFEDLFNSINWVDSPGHYDKVPDWYKSVNERDYSSPNHIESQQLKRKLFEQFVPQEIKLFIKNFLDHSGIMAGYQNIFEHEIVTLDAWIGAEELDWHWDGIDQSDFILLVYMTDSDSWKESDGGALQVGRRPVDKKNWLVDYSEVEILDTVTPGNGKIVIVNNKDPRFVHRVTPVISKHKRTVLTAGVNFKIKP